MLKGFQKITFWDNIRSESYLGSLRRFKRLNVDSNGWSDRLHNLSAQLPESYHVNLWRTLAILFLALVGGIVLVGRLYSLQVISGREHYLLSEQNRIYVKNVPAERGVLYDRSGEILARNIPAFSVGLIYSEIPSDRLGKVMDLLVEVFGADREEMVEKIEQARLQPYVQTVVKRNIIHDQQINFEARKDDLDGLFIIEDMVRQYPDGELNSVLMGYMGEVQSDELERHGLDVYHTGSMVGKAGIEEQYEEDLRGSYGRILVEMEATGRVKRESVLQEPVRGRDLHLTIDKSVQAKLTEVLKRGIEKYLAWGGSAMVSNVNTGEILAMVSLPTYDNNIFNSEQASLINDILNNPKSLLVNRAVNGMYAPGSTVKMAIGALALERKIIYPTTEISGSPQVIEIGGWKFPDWTYSWGRSPHGMMDLTSAIANSSDIFFYKIGGGFPPECKTTSMDCQIDGLGVDGVVEALRRFRYGQRTGIDLPGEVAGLVPDPKWKEQMRAEAWFLGNTYHLSIGQGDLLATPAQVLNATNILATSHQTPTLHLINEPDLVAKYGLSAVSEKPVSTESLDIARTGMIKAVSEGIVFPLRGSKVPVAAKTGTAEFGQLNAKGEYETHAWVTGFAPVKNPTISFVFMLEAGGQSSNAAELAREFLDWYFSEGPGLL